MATLISELVSGFSDAANGTAEFYVSGTATLSSQVYSDANATTAVTTHTLDAQGRVVRYVTELVDVVVKNSSGATVITFSPRVDARTVRVENALFTGPNGAGQTVAGGRTTLAVGLTRLHESLDAEDGLVEAASSGQELTLSEAVGNNAGVFFDAKNSYGAIGNGTQDDTAAIQAAINAALDASVATEDGGIVYLPAGEYNITAALTTPNDNTKHLTLMGVGESATIIKMSTSGVAGWLTSQVRCTVRGIRFKASASTHTGTVIKVTRGCSVENCLFESFSGTTFDIATTAVGNDAPGIITGCTVVTEGATGRWLLYSAAGTANTYISNTTFSQTGASTSALIDHQVATQRLCFSGCGFTLSSTAGRTLFGATGGGTDYYQLSDCYIRSPNTSGINTLNAATSTVVLAACTLDIASGGTLGVSGSIYDAGCVLVGSGTFAMNAAPIQGDYSVTRDRGRTPTSVAGTSYTPSLDFGIHVVTHTSGAGMAFNNPSGAGADGWPLLIIYENNTGAGVTPTWGTAFTQTAATAVANNNTAVYEFRYHAGTGAGEWICITGDPQEAGA